jgi:hypothetical protein
MSNKVFHDSQRVILDKQSTAFFENGVAIARYLLVINQISVSNFVTYEQQNVNI